MPGHLEKRSKNSWTIVIDTGRDPQTKKRKRIYKSFRGTKREAEKELAKTLVEYEQGTYIKPSTITVSEYLLWWLEQHGKAKKLALKTLESYQFLIEKHLIPEIGAVPLAKLQPIHIHNFVIKENERVSPRTVAYTLTILRQALKHAVKKWRIISSNPADNVDIPKYQHVKYQVLSIEEAQILLKNAKNYSSDYELIYTAIYTGMRRGELLALRWEDINFNKKTIKVQRATQRIVGKGYITKEPKTTAGKRIIDIPNSLFMLLKQIKKEQIENQLKLGSKYQNNDLIFCLQDGRQLDPSNLSRRFHHLAVKNDFPNLRFHDLRHTHASLLLANGEQLHVVQQRLGHEKPSTTADIYGHVIPGQQQAAAERFDSLFGRQLGGKKKKNKPC